MPPHPPRPLASHPAAINRRTFLGRSTHGIGSLALASLLNPALGSMSAAATSEPVPTDAWPGVVSPPHVLPRARRVIYLYMAGGPSHLETFDYRPKLAEMDGQPMPESITAGQQIAQLQGAELKCLAPQHPFGQFGESGQEVCSVFPTHRFDRR